MGAQYIPEIAADLTVVTTDLTDKTLTDLQKVAVKVDELNSSRGIPEAPNDDNIYVRRNGAWEILNII